MAEDCKHVSIIKIVRKGNNEQQFSWLRIRGESEVTSVAGSSSGLAMLDNGRPCLIY